MPQSTSNLLSPFLGSGNAKTSGSTTGATGIFTPNQNTPVTAPSYGILGTPGSSTVNTNAGISFGAAAPQQNVSSYPGYVNPSSVSSTVGGTNGGLTSTQRTADQSQLTADQTQLASLLAQQNAQGNAQGNTQGTIAPGTTNVNNPNPTATYPGIVGTLASTASQPSTQFTTAENNANTAQAQLQSLENAQTLGDEQIGGSRTNVSEAQGEAGNYNTYMTGQENAAAQALAGYQTQATAATGQQGTQQSGLSSAGALAAPQAANALGTYNPQTGQYEAYGGANGSGSGATTAGEVSSQIAAGAQYTTNAAILGKVNAQLPALQQAITADNFNPSSVTGINQINQWAQGNLSNSAIPEVQGSLNDIVGALSSVLGVPSSGASDFRLQFAGQIVNALQSGQSIEQALQFAVNQATAGNLGYLQGAQGSTNSNGTTGNTNSGGTIFPTTIQ